MAASEEDPSSSAIVRGLRSTVGRESTTFGFSILMTAVFGVLQVRSGTPTLVEVFCFAGGAVASFTLLEGILSAGFRRPMPQHRTSTLALGTSMNLVSVLLGMAAALGIATLIDHTTAWLLAPLCASIVYLLAESLETAIAERLLLAAGDTRADEVSA